jgi:hypothetical protein
MAIPPHPTASLCMYSRSTRAAEKLRVRVSKAILGTRALPQGWLCSCGYCSADPDPGTRVHGCRVHPSPNSGTRNPAIGRSGFARFGTWAPHCNYLQQRMHPFLAPMIVIRSTETDRICPFSVAIWKLKSSTRADTCRNAAANRARLSGQWISWYPISNVKNATVLTRVPPKCHRSGPLRL